MHLEAIVSGSFADGAVTGAYVTMFNHFAHNWRMNNLQRKAEKFFNELIQEQGGKKYPHPGKLDIVNSSKEAVAVHLVKGLRYYISTGTDIDLHSLFDNLNDEAVLRGGNYGLVGGTHYRASTKIYLNQKLVDIYLEIPFHASGIGLNPFWYNNYYNIDQTRYLIRWGQAGILISVPSDYSNTLNKIIGI